MAGDPHPRTFEKPAPDAMELLMRFPVEYMRSQPQWVGFRLVPQTEGKPKKVPVVATNTRKAASSTNPATWSTFGQAVNGLAKGEYTAVGYALAGDIVGVDLDGPRWVAASGELTQETQALVGRCGSYTEHSISGTGLHIMLVGKLPGGGRKNSDAGVEIYSNARFFIVTGRQIKETPAAVAENQAAIDDLLDSFFEERVGPTERAEKQRT